MLHKDWLKWLKINKPNSITDDDFLNFLSQIGASMVIEITKKQDLTIENLVEKFYTNEH